MNSVMHDNATGERRSGIAQENILKFTLHYHANGEGPLVVLLHGMAASLHDWDTLMPELASVGWRGISVDLMGHGESEKPQNPALYTVDNIYISMQEWLLGLDDGPPYVLVGHSLGGYLCMLFSLRFPEHVSALVLINPLFSRGQLSPVLRLLNRRPYWGTRALRWVPLKWIDTILGWDPINAAQFSPQARWQIAIDYKRASPDILRIPLTIADLTPKINQIRQPTLVLWGEKDQTLNPKSFPALAAALPKAKSQQVPGCGHQPHIGKPRLVNRLILNFLRETIPSRDIESGLIR